MRQYAQSAIYTTKREFIYSKKRCIFLYIVLAFTSSVPCAILYPFKILEVATGYGQGDHFWQPTRTHADKEQKLK